MKLKYLGILMLIMFSLTSCAAPIIMLIRHHQAQKKEQANADQLSVS